MSWKHLDICSLSTNLLNSLPCQNCTNASPLLEFLWPLTSIFLSQKTFSCQENTAWPFFFLRSSAQVYPASLAIFDFGLKEFGGRSHGHCIQLNFIGSNNILLDSLHWPISIFGVFLSKHVLLAYLGKSPSLASRLFQRSILHKLTLWAFSKFQKNTWFSCSITHHYHAYIQHSPLYLYQPLFFMTSTIYLYLFSRHFLPRRSFTAFSAKRSANIDMTVLVVMEILDLWIEQ